LVNGSTYYFKVTAIGNTRQESGLSNEASASLPVLPFPDVSLSSGILPGGQVGFSWGDLTAMDSGFIPKCRQRIQLFI